MPKSGYIIDNYTRARKGQGASRLYKSVVQPLQVRACNVHYCLYKRFRKAADESGQALRGHPHWGATKSSSTRLVRINHYHTKSKEEYLTKINVRKWPDRTKGTYREGAWNFPEWEADDSMKEAAAALRAKGVPETYSAASFQPPASSV